MTKFVKYWKALGQASVELKSFEDSFKDEEELSNEQVSKEVRESLDMADSSLAILLHSHSDHLTEELKEKIKQLKQRVAESKDL